MKKSVRTMTAKVTLIAVVLVTFLFAFAVQSNAAVTTTETKKSVGTIEKSEELVNEALTEKKMASKSLVATTEVEPVVEGATGAANEAATVEAQEAIAVSENVAVATEETVQAEEVVEEVIFAEGTTSDADLDGLDPTVPVEVASTANAPATDNTVVTVNAATTATSADHVAVEIADAALNYTEVNVQATHLGVKGGSKAAFTIIDYNTLFNSLQKKIDEGNIICYPSSDMTKGVKYFAGHNPGAMSHMNKIDVGSIVTLSNSNGESQDYRIVEHLSNVSGSFAKVSFKNSKSGSNLWSMITSGSENAVVIQFCINNQNNLFYGQAI